MKISKFNVNRSKSDFCFKTTTFVSDGLMSADDHKLLHSLKEMTGKNIEQINVVGPDLTEISPKFDAAKEKLAEQEDKLTRLYYLTESQSYCGRVWDESSTSPTAKTYCGNLTMLQQLPELLGLGGYLVQNDHTRRKLSATNHYFFEDGSKAKLDGSMGHYQWGWNKPFYITTWNENNLFFECISFEPIKGRESYYVPVGSMSASGFATFDREENRLVSYCSYEPRYRGGSPAYTTDIYDDRVLSPLGKCANYILFTKQIEFARNNGQGWYSGTMRMRTVLTVLFHIIMGTRDSQADFNPIKNSDGLYSCGLGSGVINWNINYWITHMCYIPFINMDQFVEYGDYLGSLPHEFTYNNSLSERETYSYNIPIFFGLKHPYGYLWRFTEDEFVNNEGNLYTHYIKKSMYDENYIKHTINDSVYTGTTLENKRYLIKSISYDKLESFPTELTVSASYNTYYCDSITFITNALAKNIMYGAAMNHAFDAGISRIYTIGDRDEHTSTYLCEFTEDFLLEPVIT